MQKLKSRSIVSTLPKAISNNTPLCNDSNYLTLFDQNYTEMNSVPKNIFRDAIWPHEPVKINLNKINGSINICAKRGDSGEVYIAGLSRQPLSIYKIFCEYNANLCRQLIQTRY
jgi:hypothetical protein